MKTVATKKASAPVNVPFEMHTEDYVEKAIVEAIAAGERFNDLIQGVALQCLAHALKTNDARLCTKAYKSLKAINEVAATQLKVYFMKFSPLHWKSNPKTGGSFGVTMESDPEFTPFDLIGASENKWHKVKMNAILDALFTSENIQRRIQGIIKDAEKARDRNKLDLSPETSELLSKIKAIV